MSVCLLLPVVTGKVQEFCCVESGYAVHTVNRIKVSAGITESAGSVCNNI